MGLSRFLAVLIFSIMGCAISELAMAQAVYFDSTQLKCINRLTGEPMNAGKKVVSCGKFEIGSLSGANLNQENLTGISLQETIFKKVKATAAVLDHANLVGAKVFDSNFSRVSFVSADLSGGKFHDSFFSKAKFTNAKLLGAYFNRGDLSEADFRGADLREAVLNSGSLKGSQFNSQTRLPFSKEVALERGMIYVD